MSDFMCQNPWLTFWGFLLLLIMADNAIGNICKTVVYVAKSKTKKDNEKIP